MLVRLQCLLNVTSDRDTSTPAIGEDRELTDAETVVHFNQPLSQKNLEFLVNQATQLGLTPIPREEKNKIYASVYRYPPSEPTPEDEDNTAELQPTITTTTTTTTTAARPKSQAPQPKKTRSPKNQPKKAPNQPHEPPKKSQVTSDISKNEEFKKLEGDEALEHIISTRYVDPCFWFH